MNGAEPCFRQLAGVVILESVIKRYWGRFFAEHVGFALSVI